MSTFQIAVSVCLLTFFLITGVTGCNDLTSSKSQSLNSQIVKEVQDADAQMAEQQAVPQENTGMSTTVEIIKQEAMSADEQKDVSGDSVVEPQSSADDSQAADKLAQADKQGAKKSPSDSAVMDSASNNGAQ